MTIYIYIFITAIILVVMSLKNQNENNSVTKMAIVMFSTTNLINIVLLYYEIIKYDN